MVRLFSCWCQDLCVCVCCKMLCTLLTWAGIYLQTYTWHEYDAIDTKWRRAYLMIDAGVPRQGLVRCGLGPDDRGCAEYGTITSVVIVDIKALRSVFYACASHIRICICMCVCTANYQKSVCVCGVYGSYE